MCYRNLKKNRNENKKDEKCGKKDIKNYRCKNTF